jgi:alpha-glucosidase (family GH31 glycosyl hydrolase)
MFHLENMSPSKIKLMFSDFLNSLGSVVVESTSQSQHLSTLIGISSSVVNDGQRACLKNIIPDVLNLGLIGYPFVMSDGFDITQRHLGNNEFIQPSRDLYIRWMQLSTFFPAIRYTVKPWNYDAKVIEASRNLTNFHTSSVLKAIFQSEKAILKGAPIIQPMWWNRSKDKDTFLIDDQFVVADMYLVAPILCESHVESDAAERDIYIPEGVWKDVTLDKVILGPKWLRKYRATQFHIPLFERMPEYKD